MYNSSAQHGKKENESSLNERFNSYQIPYKAVFPGKYIQGENVIRLLPELINTFGNRSMILASPTAKYKILPAYNIEDSGSDIYVDEFNGECCEKELTRLADVINSKKIEILVGMGGGKAIDTAKIAADRAGIPVIIVPTIASTDAPCSGCAVIYTEDDVFESVYYQKMNPQVVLVDLNIIAAAPTRFLVAGMGDALATWFEARNCVRTLSVNACGGYSTLTALNLAKLCYDTLLNYGAAAKIANDNNIVTSALNNIVEANTLLSGIGFESAGLAAAHSIHNGLTVLQETRSSYHGEKVAFGLLASLHLTNASPEEIDTVYTFCEEIGLPTEFADLGIAGIGRDKLMEVAVKTCTPDEFIYHEAVDVTPVRVINAMIAADAIGRERKRNKL